ncbi:MAG: Modulator of FtsH protease HflC [Alphaproteobacteria bacterium ADurb.BinA280]|jgi:membrane protease subunit HflC|nr:protease modulator HflC [Xanthomonadales bacterium]MCC6504625.1 protease modulator HflC [Aquimonas sp.]OPZ10645.1 MAG: Modulator of FtsH protease HflC [Alphaproteobacteria bacterium ADurb.BinA280]
MKPSILVGLAVLLLIGSGSFYKVDESNVAIRFQFGRVVETDIGPGLHFKIPLVQTVLAFDRRILSLDSQPERYLTFEKKDVNVDFFVKWKIDNVRGFYTATGGIEAQAMQRLRPIVTEVIRNEIAQRKLQDVVSGERGALAERFVEQANLRLQDLGIKVVDVRIKRIDLPEDSEVIASVFQRMRAERKKVANQLRAEGEEISETIRSDADRQRVVLVAEAERDAQRLRGEGDAQAAALFADAFGKDKDFYSFYRSMEAYRSVFANGDNVMVLDKDSEFLRFFEDGGR